MIPTLRVIHDKGRVLHVTAFTPAAFLCYSLGFATTVGADVFSIKFQSIAAYRLPELVPETSHQSIATGTIKTDGICTIFP